MCFSASPSTIHRRRPQTKWALKHVASRVKASDFPIKKMQDSGFEPGGRLAWRPPLTACNSHSSVAQYKKQGAVIASVMSPRQSPNAAQERLQQVLLSSMVIFKAGRLSKPNRGGCLHRQIFHAAPHVWPTDGVMMQFAAPCYAMGTSSGTECLVRKLACDPDCLTRCGCVDGRGGSA